MSENSSLSFDQMAAQERRGMRPEDNLEDEQFTRDEVLSEKAKTKAEAILAQAQKARKEGNAKEIAQLTQEVMSDPELRSAIVESNDLSAEAGLNVVKQAQAELSAKMQRLISLSADALSNNRATESLFTDEERLQVIERVKALESTLSGTDVEAINKVIFDFSKWYQNDEAIIKRRIQAKKGYFGGFLPEGLAAQARLFDQIKGDVDNLNHYQALNKSEMPRGINKTG